MIFQKGQGRPPPSPPSCAPEVIKLKSFESGVDDVIPRMYKAFHPCFSLNIFVNFMEEELFTQFYGRLDHEFMKLRSFE